jgi:hypothetical protein
MELVGKVLFVGSALLVVACSSATATDTPDAPADLGTVHEADTTPPPPTTETLAQCQSTESLCAYECYFSGQGQRCLVPCVVGYNACVKWVNCSQKYYACGPCSNMWCAVGCTDSYQSCMASP